MKIELDLYPRGLRIVGIAWAVVALLFVLGFAAPAALAVLVVLAIVLAVIFLFSAVIYALATPSDWRSKRK
jgi:hypothetical protein